MDCSLSLSLSLIIHKIFLNVNFFVLQKFVCAFCEFVRVHFAGKPWDICIKNLKKTHKCTIFIVYYNVAEFEAESVAWLLSERIDITAATRSRSWPWGDLFTAAKAVQKSQPQDIPVPE